MAYRINVSKLEKGWDGKVRPVHWFPVYLETAGPEQAKAVANVIKDRFPEARVTMYFEQTTGTKVSF